MPQFADFLSTNIYDPCLTPRFLLMGSCIPSIYPQITTKMIKKWGNGFLFCLESFHYNQLFSKLENILALGKTSQVTFLTPDGSPHCVQMHYTAKYLSRGLKHQVSFKHFVIHQGETYSITSSQVDDSKQFHLIGTKLRG